MVTAGPERSVRCRADRVFNVEKRRRHKRRESRKKRNPRGSGLGLGLRSGPSPRKKRDHTAGRSAAAGVSRGSPSDGQWVLRRGIDGMELRMQVPLRTGPEGAAL